MSTKQVCPRCTAGSERFLQFTARRCFVCQSLVVLNGALLGSVFVLPHNFDVAEVRNSFGANAAFVLSRCKRILKRSVLSEKRRSIKAAKRREQNQGSEAVFLALFMSVAPACRLEGKTVQNDYMISWASLVLLAGSRAGA